MTLDTVVCISKLIWYLYKSYKFDSDDKKKTIDNKNRQKMKAWKDHLEILSRYINSLVDQVSNNMGDSFKQASNCLMRINIDLC